jgi:hypothetical protein
MGFTKGTELPCGGIGPYDAVGFGEGAFILVTYPFDVGTKPGVGG